MSKSHRSSSASASCQLEWRPSRWVCTWLWGLSLLAPLALLQSGLPGMLAWPLAGGAWLWATRERRAYRSAPPRRLWVTADASLQVDGHPQSQWRVHWRGRLAFIAWRAYDGRCHVLAFWPDTLDAAARRELKLATPTAASVSPAVGMAT